MKPTLLVCVVALGFSPCVYGQTWTLYDNFSNGSLDPAKWYGNGVCYNALECERQIRGGRLHLRIRGFGLNNTDESWVFSDSTLSLTNPSTIAGLGAIVTVTRVDANLCPSNSDFHAGGHAILDGSFFNAGSGSPSDDIGAFIFLDHNPNFEAPGQLEAVGFVYYTSSGSFIGSVNLGEALIGERVSLSMRLDKPNDRFVFRLQRFGPNAGVSEESVTYTQSDSLPPANGYKSVGVRMLPPNCSSQRTFSDLRARFDNVKVLQ